MAVKAPKRKSGTEDNKNAKKKKRSNPKKTVTSTGDSKFDFKLFRKEISSSSGNTVALNQFLQLIKLDTENVIAYVQAGGNSGEILRQINDEHKKNPAVVGLVFSVLQIMFDKIHTDVPLQKQEAEDTCRYFLNTFMSTIDFMLSDKSNNKEQIITLDLLTSIVKLNFELGLLVLNQVNFHPRLISHLAKFRHAKNEEDVRASFVVFIMSFFTEGNSSLIKSLIEKQGVLSLVISDLVKDKAETVVDVINTLKKHIVENSTISKTNKIKVFNSDVIAQVFNLFNWKCKSKDSEETSKTDINEATGNLLFQLCTSHKLGIYFTDITLGTSEIHTSQHLWKALESLQAPWNNEFARELILKIIFQCPDLHKPVLNVIEESFIVRNSEQWLKTIIFLKELITLFSSNALINTVSQMNNTNIYTFIKNVCLPAGILTKSTEGLKSTDYAIKNEIVLLLSKMLQSVKCYFDFFSELNISNRMLIMTRTQDVIVKLFPDVDYLVSAMHSAMDNKKFQSNLMETDSIKISAPSNSEFILNILDLILIYDEIIPESLDPISTTLDSKRMLEKVNKMDIDKKEKLMLKITKFLLSADKFAFAPGKPLFHEILNTMFTVYLSSDEALSLEARSVLQDILITTGMFEKNNEEVDILLQIIQNIGMTDGDITNVFIDLIEDINQKIDSYKSNLDSIELNSNIKDEVSKINFVEIFENLNEAENQKYDSIFIPEKPSLTEFFIGILNFIPKEESENYNSLKNKYLINLFHLQENPKKILKIIKDYTIDDSIKKYMSKWAENPTNISSKIYSKSSLLFKLSKHILSDDELNPDDLFNDMFINTSEAIIVFNMALFYLGSLASFDKSMDLKASNCEVILTSLLDLSLKKFESKPLYIKFLKKLLSHNVVLSCFQPFPNKNIEKNAFITKMVLKFTKIHMDNNINQSNINYYLLPYKQKMFSSLEQHIKKCGKSKKGMNFSNLEEILSTVSFHKPNVPNLIQKIVNLNVTCMIDEESGVSSWLKILCFSINLFTEWNEIFSIEIFKNICLYYSKLILELEITINLVELEEALFKYLIKNPDFINAVPYAVFESIFNIKHINKSTVKLSCLILKFNENVLPKFVKVVKCAENMEKRELVIPLLQSASHHSKFLLETELLQNIYSKYESAIQKIIDKPHKVAQLYIDNCSVVEFLIQNCMSVTDCQKILKKVHKFETAEIFHINILEAVYLKAISSEENLEKVFSIQENFLLNVLFLSSVALKKEDVANSLIERLTTCLKSFVATFQILIQSEDEQMRFYKVIIENSNWQNFIKSVLKQSLQTEKEYKSSYALFEVLSFLIDLLYSGNHDDIKNIFEMTTSHSEFLNVILNNQNHNVKLCLVKLLLVLVQKDTSVAKSVHIPIYLSAYHATRSKVDRAILQILNIYESSGISMGEYQPYLWGDTACNHYAVRIKRNRRTLWSNPTPNHVLNLLDKEIISNTVKYFSIKSSLEPNYDSKLGISNEKIKNMLHDLSVWKNKKENNVKILQDKIKQSEHSNVLQKLKNDEFPIFEVGENIESMIYDPSFLLPLLNFIMAPGSSVFTHRIVRGGVLAIPLIGLSSMCPNLRAASYTVLHRFYALLESEMYYKKDKLLWTGFLDSLRNSLNTAINDSPESENSVANLRLPAISAVYLAKSIFVMMHPLDPLFKPVNYFVIGKMSINLTVIPDFLDMFHNSDISYVERRIWILEVIRDGIKSFTDVKVLLKSVAFKILFDFYNSCLAKDNDKLLILQILNACILIPKVGKILREGYGLLSWLSHTCKHSHNEKNIINSLLVKIVSNLWFSFTSHSVMKSDKNKGKKAEDPASLSEDIQQEMFFVLTDLLPKLSFLESSDRIIYLDIFRKMCKSCIKSFSYEQILTLLNVSTINLKNNKYDLIMNNALQQKKKKIMLPCIVLIEQCEKNTYEYKVTKYFYEIASKWLF